MYLYIQKLNRIDTTSFQKMLLFTGKWSHLTITEKRLADVKKSSMENDLEMNKDDPGSGLMKIMQSMYEKGDADTKRMIAKAWTEGQEKIPACRISIVI